jgi:signal transduction histidine kinase
LTRAHHVLDQTRRRELADAIVRRRDDIGRRWLERFAESSPHDDATVTELRDAMPMYLMRLAEGLRTEHTAQRGGSSSWTKVAREHANTRVSLGFDIDQLVQDFIVLRSVIADVLEEEGVLTGVRDAEALADLIDGAIAAAVKSYVASRDFEMRRQAAEHVAFITHELRGPLTNASLATVHLRRGRSVAPEQDRMLAVIDRNLRRTAELVDQVLLVEQDAHALKPQLTNVPLRSVFDETVAAAKLTAEAKGLHLEAHFDPDLVVEVDPKLAVSAIDNVVQNALKYTEAGNIQLDVEDRGDDVVVHVRDSGPGLSHQELGTIFEPFRRGESGAGKVGSGLGLAIARRALEAQGGSIHVESERGHGSHFWLTLPKPHT